MGQLLFNVFSLLLALSGCLIIGALVLNDVPLNDPPGPLIRLGSPLIQGSLGRGRSRRGAEAW